MRDDQRRAFRHPLTHPCMIAVAHLNVVELGFNGYAGRFPADEAAGIEYGWHVWEMKQIYLIGAALGDALNEGRWLTHGQKKAICSCGIAMPVWWRPNRRTVVRTTWPGGRVEYYDLLKPFTALGALTVECLKANPHTGDEVPLYPRESNTSIQRAMRYLGAVKVAPYSYAGSLPGDELVGVEYGPHIWTARKMFVIGKALSDCESLTSDQQDRIRRWGVPMPVWWTPDRRAVTRVTWPKGHVEYHGPNERVVEDPKIEPKIERITIALWTGNEVHAGATVSDTSLVTDVSANAGIGLQALPPAPRYRERRFWFPAAFSA
jgi:hypothetical protein